MELATIIEWQEQTGFGFAQPDHGDAPVFVHITAFTWTPRPPRIGDRIEMEVIKSRRGPKARYASIWEAGGRVRASPASPRTPDAQSFFCTCD